VRLYGLRMWVEQSYKQVKHALGWSEYQVRSDQAMRRHWQLVCCAFSDLVVSSGSHSCGRTTYRFRSTSTHHATRFGRARGLAKSREKKGARNIRTTTGDLAQSLTCGQSLARTLGLAPAVLARVVATAPTSPAPAARFRISGEAPLSICMRPIDLSQQSCGSAHPAWLCWFLENRNCRLPV
jgi:hypothetical protein